MGAWRNWQTCLPAGRRAKNALMYFVYAISSKNKNYTYVGMTDNLKRRFYQHNSGKEKTTKPYLPFELLFTQEFNTRKEARILEKKLKSGYGKEFLKNL